MIIREFVVIICEFIFITLRSILVSYNNVSSNDGLYNWNKFIFKR